MKFNCPKCKKEFALSPKLAGRQLRVRCTSCGTVFKMRITGPAPEPVSAVSDPQPSPAPEVKQPAPKPVEQPAPEISDPVADKKPAADLQQVTETASSPEPEFTPRTKTAATRVPRSASSSPKYFAVIGGKRLGPMPLTALKRLVSENKISRTTLLWRKGLPEWLPADKISELAAFFPALATKPPPLPQPVSQLEPQLEPEPEVQAVPEAPVPEPKVDREEPGTEQEIDFEQTLVELPRKRKVKGEVLMQIATVDPDEEPTDQEVALDELDTDFFANGDAVPDAIEVGPDIGAIEFGDSVFPEVEEQGIEKDAQTSLRDFSVMVRLSRKSRRTSVFGLTVFAIIAAVAMITILAIGDPMGWRDPVKQDVEYRDEGHSGLFTELQQKKRLEQALGDTPSSEQENDNPALDEDPDKLLKAMQKKEWKVSLDEEEMAVDRAELASKFSDEEDHHSGKERKKTSVKKKEESGFSKALGAKMKSGTYKKGSVEGDDEISLEEFAASYSVKNDDIGAALTKSGTGGSKGLEATDRKFNSAMGNFLGKGSELKERKIVADVKERKGDGSALKALVARRVSSKVNAERKRIQSCVDRHSDSYTGSGGQLRASLHFGENGKVHQVTIKGGSKQLEKCFHEIFVGWRISMIHRKIKIPIAVRFE